MNVKLAREFSAGISCIMFLISQSNCYEVKGKKVDDPNVKLVPFDKTLTRPSHLSVCTAFVNVTLHGSDGNETVMSVTGQYSTRSPLYTASGRLVHVTDAGGSHDGCQIPVNAPGEPWVALVSRGTCRFDHKLEVMRAAGNCTGVIVYNHRDEDSLLMMDTRDHDVVAVFIHNMDGILLSSALDNDGQTLSASISLKEITVLEVGVETATAPVQDDHSHPAFSSVIFIAAGLIFFCVLILICIILCSFKTRVADQRRRAKRVKFSSLPPQQVLYSVPSLDEIEEEEEEEEEQKAVILLDEEQLERTNQSSASLFTKLSAVDEVEKECFVRNTEDIPPTHIV